MGLRFVLGRAGTGKSEYCFQEMKKHVAEGQKVYMITPEQFSYMQEKRLLKTLKNEAALNAEIITFNRMAERIALEVGGSTDILMSKSTKAMLLYSIMQENKTDFTYLGKTNQNLELIIRTITEFKKHNLTPHRLEENSNEMEDKILELKLKDMSKIYSEYENKIKDKFIDEDDKLTKLSINIEKSNLFKESFVYVDEFAGFTAQEYEILRKIIKQAKQVTIALCMDVEKENDIYIPNKKVMEKIIESAKNNDLTIEDTIVLEKSYRFKNDELKHLEENLYENKVKTFEKENENIKLFLAANPYYEIEHVAKEIVKLVRDENYKYNDISVIARNVEDISSTAQAVFAKYNIPIYIDSKDELLQNIVVKYVFAILEIFSKNWSLTSVLDYIKLGFTDVTKEEIYLIEDFAKKWGIKGSKWYKEDWQHENDIEEINNIRKKIVEPLINFKSRLSKKRTVRDISIEIYNFLNENNFYEILNNKIAKLEETEEFKIANNYKLSVENLNNVLDEINLLFGEEEITFERYIELLKTGITYKELGSIPQTIDQVIVGDIDRSRTHKVKATFIIGVNDGVFPRVNKDEGFFDDKDREILKGMGTELAKGTKEMLYDEEFNIYKAMTTAEEKLFISYSSTDKEGKALRRSAIITKIKKIFPKLEEESDVTERITEISSEESTFNELLYNIRNYKNGDEIDLYWFDVYNWYINSEKWHEKLVSALCGLEYTNKSEDINLNNIEKLYGKTLKTSISKLEKYNECAFSFHLKYGLKLKEEEEYKIKTIDKGSFMHEIVDSFFEEKTGEEIKNLSKEDVEKDVERLIEEKLKLKKNLIFTSSPKFIVLTNKLKKVVAESIFYIVSQMQNSDFEVLGNEVEFNKKIGNIEIVGKVDRIDIAENEDGKFIRIIDYKSSSKDLDLNKVVQGLQIQLLTYIDIMSEKTNSEPVGMLYFNLIEPIVSKNKNLSEEEIQKEIKKAFKMKGLVLSDVKIIKMMDKALDYGASSSIPVTLDKAGNITTSRSSVLTKEEFMLLQDKIQKLIKQISDEILSGKIEIKPKYNMKTKKASCEYCPYRTICGFNIKENGYSYIQNKSKDSIFEELRKQ